MRAVLDPNVYIAALISPTGAPGQLIASWVDRRLELVVSTELLEELVTVLERPKFRRWVCLEAAHAFVAGLREAATLVDDATPVPGATADPDDDYLVALARAAEADYLVSGDAHLTEVSDPDPPVLTPRQLLALLEPV